MKLIITDMIFNEFPELALGVVILHNIGNSQTRAEITEMLREAEAHFQVNLVARQSLNILI